MQTTDGPLPPILDTVQIHQYIRERATRECKRGVDVNDDIRLLCLVGLEKAVRVIGLYARGKANAPEEMEQFFIWLTKGNEPLREFLARIEKQDRDRATAGIGQYDSSDRGSRPAEDLPSRIQRQESSSNAGR